MRKVSMFLVIFLLVSAPVFALLNDFVFISKDDIKALADDKILDVYIQAKVEASASKTFYGKAGFTPKEYDKYKALLILVINLRQEMALRQLKVPPIDDWLPQ